jgi:hypothetical protein
MDQIQYFIQLLQLAAVVAVHLVATADLAEEADHLPQAVLEIHLVPLQAKAITGEVEELLQPGLMRVPAVEVDLAALGLPEQLHLEVMVELEHHHQYLDHQLYMLLEEGVEHLEEELAVLAEVVLVEMEA